MSIKMLLAAVGTLALLNVGAAYAQSAKPAAKARTAKSLECSKDADSKNIHGKARKKFMRTCKKA
jgi:psiF repeat